MKFSIIPFISFFILICQNFIKCNDIIGCGGFIKADIKGFDFKKLSVHLTFLDGTVNYETDILPNGAYSVPIYDAGNYIIKIVGPVGWAIEPVDGYQLVINSQDTCTDDYNFKFVGFSINGKVTTANINRGPSGIVIYLLNNSQVISQTTTVDGGDFIFSKIMPGNYSLNFKSETDDGKSLELNDTNYNFQITNDNVYIKESFIIFGYPVFGNIKFYDEPIKDVHFYLFSKSINMTHFNFSKYSCLNFNQSSIFVEGYNSLCKTVSNIKGEFIFPLLPGGRYLLVPMYQSNISSYDIFPNQHEFEITSSPIDLRGLFQIKGFSVIGRVINFDGSPISNAEIYVDSMKFSTKSDSYGNFILKGVKKGNYDISILFNGYVFNKSNVIFNPRHPDIGSFGPYKISICGSIVFGDSKSRKKELIELSIRRKVLLINESSGDVVDYVFSEIENPENLNDLDKHVGNVISRFCFYTVPGSYIVKPVVDPPVNGLSLAPTLIKVVLKSIPVVVKFSPFRGTISGIVKCIDKCNPGEFEVTLKSKTDNTDVVQLTQHISISNELFNQGNFHFKDIVPGNYQIDLISANSHVPLDQNRWCWSKTTLLVDISDKNVNDLLFEQVGFSVPFHSSHEVKIDYFHSTDSGTLVDSKFLAQGVSKVCFPKSGKYEIKITTCHKMKNDSLFIDLNQMCVKHFDFRDPQCHIAIDIAQFQVAVNFDLIENVDFDKVKDFKEHLREMIRININNDSIANDIIWNENKGSLKFWVVPDKSIEVSVNSSQYLVQPKILNFQLPKTTVQCLTNIGTFTLESGTFLYGTVTPALKEITVEIRKKISSFDEDDIETVIGISETDGTEQFSFGPLNSSFKYEIKVFKAGYKIVLDSVAENHFHFKAYKLAELVVEVADNATGKLLPGILLSIIGDDVRKNELTNEDGKFVFVGLTPGAYYLRAMMKELEFTPYGAVEVKIVEGSMEKILIKATRTSFSLYGKIVSLNGEPEPGVIIEGDPIKDQTDVICKKNLLRSEHAVSDDNGSFRIRGLQPGCRYLLSLKSTNANDENAIIRSYPNTVNIKMQNMDMLNVKIYALRDINLREISAMVNTNSDIYMASLNLMVFPSDNPDNVIAAHKFVSEGIYFQMSLPQMHKKMEYVVRLQSSLSPLLYNNISAQEQILKIDPGEKKSFYKHFEFDFYPVKKSIGDNDIATSLSSSLILPFLIILFSIVFFKKDSFEPFLHKSLKIIKSRFGNSIQYSSSTTLSSSSSSKSNTLDAIEISELNNAIAKPKSTAISYSGKKMHFSLRPKKV